MNSSEISFRDTNSSQKISNAAKATKQPQVLELSQMSSYKSNLKEGLSKQDIQQPLFETQENELSIESRSDTESNSCCAKLRRWLLSPEHNATFKCICFSVYFITILVFLTLSFLYYYLDGGLSISAFGGSLDYLSQNLAAVPIQGIAILPINSACPAGYDAVTLGEFAGTVNGCYCPGDNVLMQGSCSRKTNCTYYDGVNSQQINYWRGLMFCIKRANNLVAAVSCDVDYTECYPGGCIPANETCPLTQQTLMSTLASNPLTDSTLNIQIIQDTASSDMPMVFLEISLSGLPCFDSNALPENDNTYPLSASDAEGCGDYGEDSTAFEIDSQSELDLYSQNSFSALITALPLYQNYFQQQVFLVGRNKIEINATSTCLGMDTTVISDFANTLNLLNTRTSVSLAYGAYLHIIVFVSCLLVYFFKKSGLSFRKQIFQDDSFQFLYLVFVLLEFALYFQLFIYITGVTISLTSQVNQINTYTTSQCFINDQVNAILLDFGDSIEGTVNAVYGFSGLLFFAQAGSLILLAIGLIGGKLHAVKKKRKNTD